MTFRSLLLLAAAVLPTAALPIAAQAATIQTSFTAWTSALGGAPYVVTSVVDPGFDPVNGGLEPISGFMLANGTGVALSGTGDTVYQSGFLGPQFGDGYTGQVVDSTTGTETLTFSRPVTAFGFTIKPDDAGLPPTYDPLTITLSDGTTFTAPATFGLDTVQFLGFTGAPETSLTVSTRSGNDLFFGEFATPVPEPASMGLLIVSLISLAAARRRA